MKMNDVPSAPADDRYIPGYVLPKRLMVLAGVLLVAVGFSQLWTPLHLVLFGERASAEAVRIVKEKPGVPPLVLTDDVQVRRALEERDRSFVFWNEFRFLTASGRAVEVRCPVGTQLKPLFPLADADGLPTTVRVCYDPGAAARAIFPLVLGTWLAPALLVVFGLGAILIGGAMLRWARTPLRLPRVGERALTRPPL